MEKNTFILFTPSSWAVPIKKIIMIINFTTLLMIITLLQVSADGFSQITLNEKNASLEQVFESIESQSDYVFFLRDHDLKNQIVNLQVNNVSIEAALSACFKDLAINYKIIDKTVVVKRAAKIDGGKSSTVSLVQHGQNFDVRGKVSDKNGNGLSGVSIRIKGSNIGTTTDANGLYVITVSDGSSSLLFSYLGFISREIAVSGQRIVNVEMSEESTGLSEVIVTALGIKREAKSLGYAATSVNTEQLADSRTTNVGNSLQGKVAGLNVSAPPTGQGGSSKIRIRGQSSFGGSNSPLIVVNGVPINNDAEGAANSQGEGFAGEAKSDAGDGLQSINPDDIASMTVLKGAAAAALYGFRAKDGAIIITTKSGSRSSGIGVEYNSNFQADQALDYTDFQYEYGQGENGIRNASVADARRTGVWSFGPKFDNQPMWQVDGTEKPYAPFKDRVKAFYNTGTVATNSLAISGGSDQGSFRLSFANTNSNGIIPNSKFDKKVLNLGLNYQLSEKLSTHVNANYSNEKNTNPPIVTQQDYNINQTLYTLANSIDPRWLESAYQDPETGNEINPARFTNRTNPYWTINKRREERKRDRLFGNISLRYEFAPWLYAQARVGQDYFSITHNANRPTGTAFLPVAATGFNGNFYQDAETFRETNLDFLIGANKEMGDFAINATLGGNTMDQHGETLSTSVTNFYVRDLYTIGNGQIKEPGYSYHRKKVNSLYATIDLSYRNYLFLNITGRNDWFSTLNPKSNNYLYPSVSTSYVFSESMGESLPSWLTYGKLRAAYAEVGGDTNPYTNALFYSLNSNPFGGTALGGISGSVSPNPNLRPLKVKEAEIGLELSFLEQRVSLDFAVYRKNTIDEILDVDISNASGFGSTKVNVGKLRNEGVEGLLSVVAVKSQNLRWETAFNYTYNKSEVLQLADGQQKIDVGTGEYIGFVSHEVGLPMGSLRGVDYKRDEQGRVITSNGRFLAGNIITYGSAIPKHIGGWLNTVTYKGIRFFAQIDFKAGHKMMSNSNFNFMREGLHKASLVGREGGVIFPGVNVDGTPNTKAVEAEAFYSDYRSASIATPFVYDASFIRWRNLSIGYDLTRFVNKTFIRGLNINVYVNNLFIIKKSIDNLDPETQYSASDLLSGMESHSLPTTRGYGLNLNVKF